MSKREAYWVHDDKGGYWQIPVEGEAYNFRTPPGFVMHPAGEAVTDAEILWDMRMLDTHLKDSDSAIPMLVQGVRRVLRRVMRPAEAQPGEWVLVPREPTLAMVIAWRDAPDVWVEAYAAMLHAAPPPPAEAQAQDIGPEWKPCRKRPVIVHVREQRPGEQHVSTREGITAVKPDDLIMCGVEGEEYPIGRELFAKTYDMVPDAPPSAPVGVDAELKAFDAWFQSEQGKPYDGGWEFGRAAWLHRAALAQQPAAVALSREELDTCRQWFDSVQDTNGGYLTPDDYVLAEKLYRSVGMRVPDSIGLVATQQGGAK